MEAFGQVVRNLVRWALCSLGFIAFICLNLVMVATNYLASSYSFYYLNYHGKLDSTLKLIAGYMSSPFDETSVIHLSAIGLAAASTAAFFIVFHSIFNILKLLQDRKAYQLQHDYESAGIVTGMIKRNAFYLLGLVPLLILILSLNMELLSLRSVAGATAQEDPAMAAKLAAWEAQLRGSSVLWTWGLNRVGAWSYIIISIIGFFGLEYTLIKLSDSWARLVASIQGLIGMPRSKASGGGMYGFARGARHIYDPPARADYYPRGRSVVDDEVGHSSPRTQNQAEKPLWESSTAEVSTPDSAEAEPAAETSAHSEAHYEVIGGAAGETVTLEQALADKRRYWVDPQGPCVWNAQYRRALFSEGTKNCSVKRQKRPLNTQQTGKTP